MVRVSFSIASLTLPKRELVLRILILYTHTARQSPARSVNACIVRLE